jgi:hypothetical protein
MCATELGQTAYAARMSARTWAGSTVTAIGVAAAAGAAQLGVAYGLGIVAWLPAADATGKVMWQASLAWVVWIAATSTAIGAIFAHWLAPRTDSAAHEGFLRSAMRITLALGAAVGALVTLPLVAVPARAAESPQNFAPEWTAAGYVGVGVLVGLAVALAALNVRAITANVVASMAYLWVLAVLAVVDGLRDGNNPLLVQLGIWRFSDGPMLRSYYVPGVLLMLASAMIIGFLASWRAGRRGDSRIGVATSGATGPLLVAAAYLLAAPVLAGSPDVDVSQWSAHLFAPWAVIAGLAGSVAVAAIGPVLSPEEKAERSARAAQRRAANEAERAAKNAQRAAAKEAKRQADEARISEEAKGLGLPAMPTAPSAADNPADQTAARPGKSATGTAAVPVAGKPPTTGTAAESKTGPGTAAESKTRPSTTAESTTRPTATAGNKDASGPVTAKTALKPGAGRAVPSSPAPAPPAPPQRTDNDLADDGYAPSRAYQRRTGEPDPDPKAYASDTVDPAAPAAPAPRPVGRVDAPVPLWPSSPNDSGDGKPPKGRRPRR